MPKKNKNGPRIITHGDVKDCLNASIRVFDLEFGVGKPELLRTSQVSGVYLFNFAGQEFEIEIKEKILKKVVDKQ